ncbi:uncharacterized protein PITG_12739 [Phytophthora infestans T30-4]|uniref:Secreted RxLR effector peptide protein n=1 Tax=Phytophthora infestans (strain T30-4) TaxID=403677 RepID=D0NL17_PHYIT|nr:uncharacterized protein PITG_12739 [Phytophthora infestans T30-4]EEY60335.1 hypothetical protein PITG_12739 [Phytophthora infestans T30-4]|eukprot:XP_002900131.1 hypothetical protein PITG_12739 [Phytophthora infestans T30-4]
MALPMILVLLLVVVVVDVAPDVEPVAASHEPVGSKAEVIVAGTESAGTTTQAQLVESSAVEHVTLGVIQKGIDKYAAVTRQRRNPDWQILIAPGAENEIEVDDASELIENEVFEEFDPASFCRPAWRR